MNIDQLGKEVTNFITSSQKATEDYIAQQVQLEKQVAEGLKGWAEAADNQQEAEQALKNMLNSKAKELNEKIASLKESEAEQVENSYRSITADDLAELTLLSQLKLSQAEMDKYIQKYAKTPLAIRKLEEIATEQRLMNQFPPSKEEFLSLMLNRMENHISRFAHPDLNDSIGVKREMIVEGATRGINEDISTYNQL